MSNAKLIVVAVIIVVVSVFASYLLAPKIQTVIQTIQPSETPVGGIASNYLDIGGVRHYAGSMTLKTATSTICRIQGPAATSTLIYASVNFLTTSSTALTVNIAKTTNALSYATTTLIGSAYTTTASSGGTILASSTPVAGDLTVFNPNDWLVVKAIPIVAGGWVTALAPTGECKAEWIQSGR
jgi:hypothetical protein